jgi:hypothetical protein
VSRVHRMVDWWPDCGPWSMVDHNHRWRSNLTGVPVHGTSPWWHGEQEKGTGIPTPVGTRWWRGSDSQASAKGGGGGASSMRRCSRHGGEGRRRAASTVWRGGDGGDFYRGGEGRRSARWRWCAIKRRPVTKVEARGLTSCDEGKRRPHDTGLVRPFARGEG